MNKYIRIISIIATIGSLCLASVWAFKTNFDIEPIIATIGLSIALISFLISDSSENKPASENEKSGTFSITKIILAIVFFVGVYWYSKEQIAERKIHFLEKIIVYSFEKDVEFIAGFLPIMCENQENITYLYSMYKYGHKIKDEDSTRIVKDILRIVKKVPNEINKLKPNSAFQIYIKNELVNCFKKNNLQSITPENISSPQTQEILNSLAEDLKQIGTNTNFEVFLYDKLAKAASVLVSEYSEDKLNTLIVLSDEEEIDKVFDDPRTVKMVIETVNNMAMKNLEYKSAFDGGCLKMFKDEVEIEIMKKVFEKESSKRRNE